MNYDCYLLNHMSCKVLKGSVHLTKLYGTTPNISTIILYMFHQEVFYATHNQSFPSASEERATFWVGFVEHVGDTLTHKLFDAATRKIIYRSAVRPSDDIHPDNSLVPDGGEIPRLPNPLFSFSLGKIKVNLLPRQ